MIIVVIIAIITILMLCAIGLYMYCRRRIGAIEMTVLLLLFTITKDFKSHRMTKRQTGMQMTAKI